MGNQNSELGFPAIPQSPNKSRRKPAPLKRISFRNFIRHFGGIARESEYTRETFILTRYKKPICVVYPYSKELEDFPVKRDGVVNYDEYRKQLLQLGLEQLQERKVMVTPSAVIASENLEEVKKRNKLMAAGFLLESAKMWQARNEAHICLNCGYRKNKEKNGKEI